MTLYIDIKYANLVSSRLERYKVLSSNPFKANFRCPICGDSQKNKYKCRGYFLQYNGRVIFKCHNCGESRNVGGILELVDPYIYKEYCIESFKENNSSTTKYESKPTTILEAFSSPKIPDALKTLKKISQLPWDHRAKKYVDSRQIPTKVHHKLYYCPKFSSWTNSIVPGKLNEKYDEPRLIIPLLDSFGNMFGYTGRSLDVDGPSKSKYITIILDDSKPKVFGLDTVDFTKTNYIVEGPLDSLFIPNSLAMTGSDFNSKLVRHNSVVVYDNEPRNKEITNKIAKALEAGYKVCIWPDTLKEKDINDMILSGMTIEKVLNIIDENTFSGPAGLLRFNAWRK